MSSHTDRRANLINTLTLGGLAAFCVVCQLIAGPTKDKSGAEGAVSWVFFIGFWVALVAFIGVLALMLLRRFRTAR